MQIEYNIFNKTSTRLPESLSVVFTLMPQYGFSWMLSKLGQQIDPKSVVLNGSQYQHGEIVFGVLVTLKFKSMRLGTKKKNS